MTKHLKYYVLLLLMLVFTAFTSHKFYVAIYQINFVPQKKMLQITTRIFIDDINEAIEFKFHKKSHIGSEKESPNDEVLLRQYLTEKFLIKVNGQPKSMTFHSKEIDNNVLICYLSIKEVPKITSLEVTNSVITEIYPEQQNIIQFNVNGEKQNLLLTNEKTKGMLK